MKRVLYTALIASMMAGGSAYAQPGKSKDKGHAGRDYNESVIDNVGEVIKGDKLTRDERVIIRTVFDELFGGDRERAREWEEHNGGVGKGLPPGLQKQVERTGSLPPGLEKHIRDTGTLPPGLESRRIPSEIHEKLRLGKGRELHWVGDDVYLIESATRAIIDVVTDLFRS